MKTGKEDTKNLSDQLVKEIGLTKSQFGFGKSASPTNLSSIEQKREMDSRNKLANNEEEVKIVIEYAQGKEDTIILKLGQSEEEIAQRFCQKHNLNEAISQRLTLVLEEQISELRRDNLKKDFSLNSASKSIINKNQI